MKDIGPGIICHPDPFGKAQGKVHRKISLGGDIFNLGTDHSPRAQDDKGHSRDHLFVPCPNR